PSSGAMAFTPARGKIVASIPLADESPEGPAMPSRCPAVAAMFLVGMLAAACQDQAKAADKSAKDKDAKDKEAAAALPEQVPFLALAPYAGFPATVVWAGLPQLGAKAPEPQPEPISPVQAYIKV